MPNIAKQQHVFISTGNPDTMNDETLLRPGELGLCFEWNQKSYQIVKCDSGAVAAVTTPGVVAANQLAFWKDKTKFIVTNDSRQALFSDTANSYRNRVAGIFRASITAGYYCCVLQRGVNIAVKEAGSATYGMTLIANSSSTAADALGVAINTAPNCITLGVVRTSTSGTTCYADVDVPECP